MDILITGATGKLGSEVVETLAQGNHLICAGRRPVEHVGDITNYAVDLAEPTDWEPIFASEQPEVVIHLGSLLPTACQANPEQAERVNVDATRALAVAAAKSGVRQFIFASSAAAYGGQTEIHPVTETAPLDPQTVYGKTKRDAEEALREVARHSDMQVILERIFNIYGPGFSDSAIYKLAHATVESPMKMFMQPSYVRDYVHVSDVVRALTDFEALKSGAEHVDVFNIGSGRGYTPQDVLAAFALAGIEPHYEAIEGGASVSWASIDKARKALHFDPHTELVIES